MSGSRFTAAHSTGWSRRAPRNLAGPASQGGASDLGWGLSPWGTNLLGWGDEVDPDAQRFRPVQVKGIRARLHPALARRGQFFETPPPPVVVAQQDAPDRIQSLRRHRIGFLARRGAFTRFPLAGRAPGQLDTPDRIVGRFPRTLPPARRGQLYKFPIVHPRVPDEIKSRNARVFALARRGQFRFFPLVGFAPGQLDTPATVMGLRKRRLFAVARHGVFFSVPPAVAAAAADTVAPDAIRSSRETRTLDTLQRRGRILSVPLESWRAAPVFRDQNQRRGFLARRGLFFRLPPAGLDVPDRIKSRARYGFLARRGTFTRLPLVGLAPGQFVVPDRIDSQRARTYTARRGAIRPFVPDQVIVIPPGSQALPPDKIEPANRARTFALARRGRIVFRPLVGSATGYQTAWIAPMRSRRAPALPTRRGDQWTPVPTQQQAKVPDGIIGRPRVRALSVRRSDRWELPTQYGPPPARIVRSGARPAVAAPRRRRHLFVPPTVTPAAGAPPTRIISRRLRGLSTRRGRFLVRLDTPVAFTGTAINYVIVQAPLRFISPALIRLAVAGIDASLDIDLTVIRLPIGDALVLEVEADGTATFQGQQGSKVIIVREL